MKKIALVLSFAFYTIGSMSVINSSNSFAAFPIAQTSEATATTNNPAIIADEVIEATTSTTATRVKTEKKQNFFSKMAAKLGGGKSQVIALILVLLVGGLGIHRFYLGYTWQGIVQLLTAGGCGIWWLIDLIRIVTGDLGPKDGSYDKTL